MKKWMEFPWYVLLIPLFYLMHAYNSHFGLLSTGVFFRHILYYLLLSFSIFLVVFILFRNSRKAGCWTAIFLCIFFFFGASYDFLAAHGAPGFLFSYKFLLPFILALLVIAAYLLKEKGAATRLNRFFLLLFTVLFAIEVGTMVFYFITDKKRKNDLAGYNTPLNIHLAKIENVEIPDIFFIVFDEYASSKALKKYLHFDNNGLDSSLRKNGFYISTNSQSNYNSTPLSIASTFDMQYFNKDLESAPNDGLMLLQGAHSVYKSRVPGLLEEQGYEIINYGLIDIKNHPVSVIPAFPQYEIKIIGLETLWGRIRRDFNWSVAATDSGNTIADTAYINRNRNNYDNFTRELQKNTERPRFVTSHVLLPHRPAWLDRRGNIRSLSMDNYSAHTHDSLYLEQVMYANILIDSLANIANKPRKRPLVLIIEGDHGNRFTESGMDTREKQFMNLNAYYFSDNDYSLLYDSISPVNSFRVILNKYFNTRLPLLKDSTIWLR